MSGHVRMCMQWNVRHEQADAVVAALQRVMTATRREPGCTACSLANETEARAHVRLSVDWDSEAYLVDHLRSREFAALAGLLESAMEPPQVEFTLPSGTRGLDYVEEARARPWVPST